MKRTGDGEYDMVGPKKAAPASAATTALLTIPFESDTLDPLKTRVRASLSLGHTHLYFDASFLMWMTKLGSESVGFKKRRQ